MHDFLVYDQDQWLRIDVFNSHLGQWHIKGDDMIGRAAPMTVSEALELSEKNIALYDTSLPWDSEIEPEKAGCLQLRFEWLALSEQGWRQDTRCVVEVKVDEVYMPSSLGHAAGLRATIGGQTSHTQVHVHDPQASVFAVRRAREQVAERCFKYGKTVHDAAFVTSLDEVTLGRDIGRRNKSRQLLSHADSDAQRLDDTPLILPLEYVLRFVLPTSDVADLVVELELFDDKEAHSKDKHKHIYGTAKVPVLNKSLGRGGLQMAEKLQFHSPSGKSVEADISISVMGLQAGAKLQKKASHLESWQHEDLKKVISKSMRSEASSER
jgi:hypothetical protein